jgi:hypothetical protein
MNKHEIPAAILDAAAIQYLKTQGYSEKRIKLALLERDAAWQDGERRANLILEAANLPELLAERDLLARQVAKYEEAIQEAEAILGGEYGDEFGAFAELVSDARFMRREAGK